jgi:hypothetical protein
MLKNFVKKLLKMTAEDSSAMARGRASEAELPFTTESPILALRRERAKKILGESYVLHPNYNASHSWRTGGTVLQRRF